MMNALFLLSEFKLTISKITSRSRGPVTSGLTMQAIENGNERMRNPPAAAFATTKNLHVETHNKYDIQIYN